MERSPKRRRIETPPYSNAHNDHYYNDKEQLHPEIQERIAVRERFKSRLEDIFEKYSKDFTGVGDEIDLVTGEVIVNNGHLQRMEDEGDLGNEISDEEEVFSADGRFEDDLDTGYSSVHDGSRTSRNKHKRVADDEAPLETLNYDSALAKRLQIPGRSDIPPKSAAKDPRWQIPDVSEVEFEAFRSSQENIRSWNGDHINNELVIQQKQAKKRAPNQAHKSPGPSLWAQPRQYIKTAARWQKQQQLISVSQESIWALEDGTSDAESLVQVGHEEEKEHRGSGYNTRQLNAAPRPGEDLCHLAIEWNKDGIGDHHYADKAIIRAPDGSIHTIQQTQTPSKDKVHEITSRGHRNSQPNRASMHQRRLSRTASIPNTTQDTSTPLQEMVTIISDQSRSSEAYNTAYGIKAVDDVPIPASVNSTPLPSLDRSDPRMAPPASLQIVNVEYERMVAQEEQLQDKSLLASTIATTETQCANVQRKTKNDIGSMGSSKTGIFRSKYPPRKSSTASINKPFMPVKPSKISTSNSRDSLQLHQVMKLIEKSPTTVSLAASESITNDKRTNMSGRKATSGCEKQTSSKSLVQNNTIDLTFDNDTDGVHLQAERETTPIDTYSYALADPWPTRPWRADRIPGLSSKAIRRGSITTTDSDDDVPITRKSYSPSEVIDRIVADTDTDLAEMEPAQMTHEPDQSVHRDDVERDVHEEIELIMYEEDQVQSLYPDSIHHDDKILLATTHLSTPTNIEKPQATTDLYPLPQSPGRLAIDGSQETPRKSSPRYKHADIVAEFGESRPLTKANLLLQQEIPSISQDSVLSFLNSQETAHLSKKTPTPKASVLPQRSHRCSISSANICGINGVRCGRTFCFNCTSRAATQEDVEF